MISQKNFNALLEEKLPKIDELARNVDRISLVKACSSSFYENKNEDLKVIDVSPIKYLFSNMNLDKDGTRDESTLVKRRPNDPEFLDLDAKIGKSGIEEVKTLHSNELTILDLRNLIMMIVL